MSGCEARKWKSVVPFSCGPCLGLHPQLPSHLKDPEQSDAAQHGYANWRDEIALYEQRFENPAADDKTVKAIEQRHEVDLQTEGVHLHQHLQGEEQQQDLIGSF